MIEQGTEDTADTANTTDVEKEDAPEPVKRRRLPRLTTLLAAALLLAAVGAGVTFALLFKDKAEVDSAANAALGTARSYAVTVTTYDYQNLDRNFADVLDGATGEFKDQYTGASGTLRQLIQQAKATAKGTVIDAGVKSAGADRVDVTLFVDQSVTNAAAAEPRVDRNRVLMTLERHQDRWLVSNLQLV
ncbi:hypothetical protein [Amycolatopsis nigrescens]|uniref:hypothetical protein n=1 Tax=Amycolatopsis nigrescens TaxID=381445 RepID=UPI0003685D1B|nr:hypothetical protein [Amycolatopsis nigrescens]